MVRSNLDLDHLNNPLLHEEIYRIGLSCAELPAVDHYFSEDFICDQHFRK